MGGTWGRRCPDMAFLRLVLRFSRVWWTAVRPFAYSASVMPVLLGTAMAGFAGVRVSGLVLLIALCGVIGLHTAGNLLNDCYDYRRGLDHEVLPGSGAVVRGWISQRQAFRAALFCLGIGIVCGTLLAIAVGWTVLLLVALGLVCALGYTRPGVCFKYLGLGDLVVLMAFGILPVFGAWWIQTRSFALWPILWSLPPGLLSVGILHGNNWRDLQGDAGQGCRTLAGMLGPAGARRYYQVLMLSPFLLVVLLVGFGRLPALGLPGPRWALLTFLVLPQALGLARLQPVASARFRRVDAETAKLHLMFSIVCAAAFWFARPSD